MGDSSPLTVVSDLAFTGMMGTYERLYAVGRDTANRNMIASVNSYINPTTNAIPTTFAKVYTQTTSVYQVSHVYVSYLNLFMCGEGVGSTPSSPLTTAVYASFSIITSATDDTLNY